MKKQMNWTLLLLFGVIFLSAGCGPAESSTEPASLAEIWPTPQHLATPSTSTPFPRMAETPAAGPVQPQVEATTTPTWPPPVVPTNRPERLRMETPVPQVQVLAWGLNVRRGPGLDYPVIAALKRGQTVPVVNRDAAGDWLQIKLDENGQIGWIASNPKHVSIDSAIPPKNWEMASTPLITPTSQIASSLTPADEDPGAGIVSDSGQPAVEIEAAEVGIFDRPGGQVVGFLEQGQVRPILTLDPDTNFAQVSLAGGQTGWVSLVGDSVRLFSGLDLTERTLPAFSRPAPAQGLTGTLAIQTVSGGAIYVIKADGTGLRRVTQGIDPQLSPDGTKIAFTRWQPRYELFTIKLDGSDERAWGHGWRQMKSPTWSADGTRLAFSFQSGGRLHDKQVRINLIERAIEGEGSPDIPGRARGIEIDGPYLKYILPMDAHWYLGQIDLDTGRYTDLATGRYSYGPTWHPTNPNLLIYKAEQTVGLYEARTNTARPITNDPHDHTPVISPDGSRIAVSYWQHDHWEVHVMKIDGSQRRRLTRTPASFIVVENRSWQNAAPAWSPDGSQIAFVTNRTGRWEIWVMDSDGSDQQPMFSDQVNDRLPLVYNGVDERMISWR